MSGFPKFDFEKFATKTSPPAIPATLLLHEAQNGNIPRRVAGVARVATHFEEIVDRISEWLAVTDKPPPQASTQWKALADVTERFALGCWAYACVSAGWTDEQLFAIDGGLIPAMHRKNHYLMMADESAATVLTGKGKLHKFCRPMIYDPPWWDDPRTVA